MTKNENLTMHQMFLKWLQVNGVVKKIKLKIRDIQKYFVLLLFVVIGYIILFINNMNVQLFPLASLVLSFISFFLVITALNFILISSINIKPKAKGNIEKAKAIFTILCMYLLIIIFLIQWVYYAVQPITSNIINTTLFMVAIIFTIRFMHSSLVLNFVNKKDSQFMSHSLLGFFIGLTFLGAFASIGKDSSSYNLLIQQSNVTIFIITLIIAIFDFIFHNRYD